MIPQSVKLTYTPNSAAPSVTTTNGRKNGRTKRYADQSIRSPFQVARWSAASENGRPPAGTGRAGPTAVILRAIGWGPRGRGRAETPAPSPPGAPNGLAGV